MYRNFNNKSASRREEKKEKNKNKHFVNFRLTDSNKIGKIPE